MRLATVAVKNLRSIRDASLDLNSVTPLLGPNGSGKSTWLLALRWFYEGIPTSLDVSDFFRGDWYGKAIEISATFADVSPDVAAADPRLAPYVRDGMLTVVLRVPGPPSVEVPNRLPARYFGTVRQHPPFAVIRSQGTFTDKTKAAIALREANLALYDEIALTARGWPENKQALAAWEVAHPEHCELLDDDGAVFGPVSDPQCPLNAFTELITVPAVHDPDDESEATGSNLLNQLVRLSVRDPAQTDEAAAIRRDAETRYRDLIAEREGTDLRALGDVVSQVLGRYAPGTEATFNYRGGIAEVRGPVAYVSLSERGYRGPLNRKGSGLQRLFIVSLIEAAAAARARAPQDNDNDPQLQRHRILCVEEPELYQHPLQARRFAQVLWGIADADGTSQVIYSTHSPEFLPPERLASYRLCAVVRAGDNDVATVSQVRRADMDAVMSRLRDAGTPDAWLQPGRLDNFFENQMDAKLREGFFAQGVVLVEGPEDAAVIDAHSQAISDPLEFRGIAILPVGGKAKMTRFAAAFAAFGVPTYLVFDGDSDGPASERENRLRDNQNIQTFAGAGTVEDVPTTGVHQRFTVFETNLTEVLPRQFPGNSFEQERDKVSEQLGWERSSEVRR